MKGLEMEILGKSAGYLHTYWENALYDVTWGRLGNASSHEAAGSEAFFLQNLHEMFVVSLMTVRLRAPCAGGVINSVTHVPVDEIETQRER